MSRNTIDHELRYTWQTVSKMYNEEASKIGGSMAIGFALLSLNPKKGTPSTSLGPKMGMESTSLSRTLKTMEDYILLVLGFALFLQLIMHPKQLVLLRFHQ